MAKLVSVTFCIVTSLILFLSALKAAEMRDKYPPLRFEYEKLTNYLEAERFCVLSVPYGALLEVDRFYT